MADAGRLKQVNMTLIREAMRGGGEHSKNELARRTGLSFPTVSRIVDDLVEAGEAKETGTAASTGGRARSSMRWIRHTACSCACGWRGGGSAGLCAI